MQLSKNTTQGWVYCSPSPVLTCLKNYDNVQFPASHWPDVLKCSWIWFYLIEKVIFETYSWGYLLSKGKFTSLFQMEILHGGHFNIRLTIIFFSPALWSVRLHNLDLWTSHYSWRNMNSMASTTETSLRARLHQERAPCLSERDEHRLLQHRTQERLGWKTWGISHCYNGPPQTG